MSFYLSEGFRLSEHLSYHCDQRGLDNQGSMVCTYIHIDTITQYAYEVGNSIEYLLAMCTVQADKAVVKQYSIWIM